MDAGPVVRITPDEVHLSDPENYEQIYHIGSKYYKNPGFYNSFGIGYSTFSSIPNSVHAVRRAALNPMFSRKMVFALEDLVQEKAEKIVNRARCAFAAGEPLDVHHGFRAISVDVITDYAFNSCYNLLDQPDFGVKFFQRIMDLSPSLWFFQQWPWVQPIALSTPRWMVPIISKPLEQLVSLQGAGTRVLVCLPVPFSGLKGS
jgi:cytochrome P450